MDTRTKIVPAAGVPAGGRVKLILGLFDPLHARHTRQLQQICEGNDTIVVALDDPPAPLLSRRGRAELAAALACVDYVVLDAEEALAHFDGALVYDLRAEHLRFRNALEEHVVRRYRGA